MIVESPTRLDALQLARLYRLQASGEAERIRERAGLSVCELAAHCRVTTATVYRWESSEVKPQRVSALTWMSLLDGLIALEADGT